MREAPGTRNTEELICLLEAEWDEPDGFLWRLRMTGTLDPQGYERFERLLRSIKLAGETTIDRRLVSLLWFAPIVMRNQLDRIRAEGGVFGDLASATNAIEALLMSDEILGTP